MRIKRFFEILPGALSWGTIILMVLLSWRLPQFVAVFIIFFDIYWVLKTTYLSLHLRSTFSIMKKNLKVNWLAELEKLPTTTNYQLPTTDWQSVYHLVIMPMYREPYEIVRESFESLASGNYPFEKFIVVLATEERTGDETIRTAKKIEEEFGNRFFRFMVTSHPRGLAGEIPGKGSNETWAAKEVKRLIIDPLVNAQTDADGTQTNAENGQHRSALRYENILVSVFDIDTQIFPEYFGRLTYVFLNAENRLRAIYQPIPLFINNIYQAPALARVISFSSTFWQMMQQSRPERLTSFSSQSIPLPALLDIGYWHTDVVSEDSRSFWQCYLRYHGDFRVEPLFYPVSMDANAMPTFWGTMKNNYRQHRRWAWGCENIPYLMCGVSRTVEANQRENQAKNRESFRSDSQSFAPSEGFLYDNKIPRWKKVYWSFNSIEGFHSWATNALMIFALGWLPVILGGKHFNVSLMSYSLPSITRFIVEISMIGVASAAFFSILLLPPRPEPLKLHQYAWYFLQWLLLPLTLIVFGCFPALESQTRMMLGGKWRLGFWVTPKSRSENVRK